MDPACVHFMAQFVEMDTIDTKVIETNVAIRILCSKRLCYTVKL